MGALLTQAAQGSQGFFVPQLADPRARMKGLGGEVVTANLKLTPRAAIETTTEDKDGPTKLLEGMRTHTYTRLWGMFTKQKGDGRRETGPRQEAEVVHGHANNSPLES